MAMSTDHTAEVPGFSVPVHRALTEHILLGGAPRAIAILNGTLAAALGLGLRLWLVGLAVWATGHFAAVWAAKRDAQFVDVVRRHLRIPSHLRSEEHTSELQSLMRISYAVFCLKKKTATKQRQTSQPPI